MAQSTAQESNLGAPTVRLFPMILKLQHVDVVCDFTSLAIETEWTFPNQRLANFVPLSVSAIVRTIKSYSKSPRLSSPNTIFDGRKLLDLLWESYGDWVALCCHTFVLEY
jgi:hypothetical protein